MDLIHKGGICFIQWVQSCENLEPFFTAASHIGNPNTAYLLTFPTAYYIDPTLGIVTVLCTVSSDWLNELFKWILYGHRPYWWVTMNQSLGEFDVLSIKQYPLTCETGPCSPSGHCMVTVASLAPITNYFYRKLNRCYIWFIINFNYFFQFTK
ncbi:hypothetical protein MN116_005172 [Schistosoma mekongi]|uniref:glucose-6-phosphatase n=1 Tax=Schistosoma mekongi TaxID=38744 RepID=A0AAE2D5B0_SCHME|nr:hypothetical protein MN116_005172 [Schistosoma mekongi]